MRNQQRPNKLKYLLISHPRTDHHEGRQRSVSRVLYSPITQIAIEGCCHGALDAIYKHIGQLETKHRYKVDLLLICGDFQAVRNHRDLQCMSVPDKYKELGGFYRY